jgi:hypothetical protein
MSPRAVSKKGSSQIKKAWWDTEGKFKGTFSPVMPLNFPKQQLLEDMKQLVEPRDNLVDLDIYNGSAGQN